MAQEIFTMKRVGLSVSQVCNLKCRLCAANAPYYNIIGKAEQSSALELLSYVEKYFTVVDYVDLFGITGGEPLVYKELPELMEGLLQYSKQYKFLEIYTNGATVPSDELCKTIKKYGEKFRRVLIDDYGNPSNKVAEASEMLGKYDIPYEIRDYHSENMHCGGWIDFGDVSKIVHSENDAANLFSKCAYPQKIGFCYSIHKGCMIPCSPVLKRWQMGLADKDDYLDLNDSSLSVEEQRMKILNISKSKFLDSCLYCEYGMCDNSPRHIPGEQLSTEEISRIKTSLAK